ncbi:MAG: hypothetical protein AAF215_27790 [Cyanobacteria bacterium P01_A01_bin.123]
MLDKAIPAGLKIWLAFLACFIILGYPVVASIFFGLIGAIAGGMVTAWWQTQGGIPEPPPEESPGTLQRLRRQLQSRSLRRLPIPRFRRPNLRDQATRPRR